MASSAPDSAASKRRLALAIIDFLNTSASDGTLAADDAESIEIATNCIAESFKVDPADSAAMADALGGQNLHAIYSVYEKLKGRTTPSTEGASSAKEARPSTPTTAAKDADTKKVEADRLKGLGNAAMQQKDYDTAIRYYTQALDLVPLNPIFLSNRAAAHSGAGRHEDARQDAEMATAADPAYTKAWSRLGLARFALGDAKGSMEAYRKGIEAEGNGGSEAMKRGYETAKRRVEEEEGPGAARSPSPGSSAGGAGGMPDLSSLASMLGGGGGGQGGQGGGMPDFGALMNNPMLRQMAQNVMSNPQLMQNMLSNPRLREMAEQFGGGGGGGAGAGAGRGGGGGGGGMPDFSQMMQDPSIMEMARNLMGGGAGGAGGNGGGAGRGAGNQ